MEKDVGFGAEPVVLEIDPWRQWADMDICCDNAPLSRKVHSAVSLTFDFVHQRECGTDPAQVEQAHPVH